MDAIQTESSWSECLSDGHIQFILEYVQQAESREAAIIDNFLLSNERNPVPRRDQIHDVTDYDS